ncbi:flippase [Ureibacillus chungkukjangi]|uniref:O-antigen/teichoic acid export membrane protein n=1 Tax=Ureibacillus chungkukjangi TaxID=1202712 RepID=A0A318TMH2_9BACL|nr:flippase [Ureibacillus chungkukjangi]MCM3386872.1 flippase [Ureibacillus chungkukjangi]PYF06052.1 O-antigen/teichoic acid export membrane protein [Ureibacillus chungkukjangi]
MNLISVIRSKFLKNTSWLLFEQIFRMLLGLVVTSLVARYLGTYNYGQINYGLAYIAIFTILSKLGLDSIIVHEIIKNRNHTGKIIGTTILLRLASAFISIIIICILLLFLEPDNLTIQILTFIQSISLIFIAFDTVSYWFQSNLQSKYAVISKSIAFFIISIFRLLLIYFNVSVVYFAFATILEAFVIGIFLLWFYYKHKGDRLAFSFQISKDLLKKSYHFLIAGLLVTVYTQMDKIMLGKMASASSVGIYAAGMTIATMWVFIPMALIDSARPIVMGAKESNQELYIRRYKQLYCAVIWIGIMASLFITIFSKPIILLIFGEEYLESISILLILVWSRIFSLIGVTRSIWLLTEDHISYQKYFLGIGAVINFSLNLYLIPKYGAIGAAIATLLAEVISSTIALVFFKKTRPLFKLIVEAVLFKRLKA